MNIYVSTSDSPSASAKLKLDGETDEMPPELQDRFDWIVAGKQAGALWNEPSFHDNESPVRHLGNASPINAKDCPLCLWLGVSETTAELLVLFTHSVKLGAKKSRRMFLRIPAELLILHFEALALHEVPEILFERPSDTRSAQSNGFLHIRFTLDTKHRSTVIMLDRQYEGRVSGTALSLLDGLKSLSEARNFDVYLKFDTYAYRKLQKLHKASRGQELVYKTPYFDVEGMYRGNRHGGFDLWQKQGWREQGQEDSEAIVNKRKRRAAEEPDTPPRYQPKDSIPGPPPAYCDPAVCASTQEVTHDATSCTPVPVLIPRSCTPVSCGRRSSSPGHGASRVFETPIVDLTAPTKLPAVDGCHPRLRPRFLQEISQWLLSAWGICPLAHYWCILSLLGLGVSAETNDLERFERARAGCTARLVTHMAKESLTEKPGQAPGDFRVGSTMVEMSSLLHELRNLIRWMLIIDPLADTHQMFLPLVEFRRQLTCVLELVDKDSHTLRYNHTDEEFDRRYRLLMETKASIVVETCFRFGEKALESRELLVARIRKEADLVSI